MRACVRVCVLVTQNMTGAEMRRRTMPTSTRYEKAVIQDGPRQNILVLLRRKDSHTTNVPAQQYDGV